MQDLVFDMDVGSGTSLFRVGMFCLLVLFVMLLYTGTQFYGLREAAAMDIAQLGRNLYRGHGYRTQLIRPLEIWHLQRLRKPVLDPQTNTQPELFTPPVYPGILAGIFHIIKPDSAASSGGRTTKADRLLMLISWFFFLVGLLLMYLLAREMFDHRVGVLSMFLYLFCDPLLDAAVSGTPLCFLVMLFSLSAFGMIKAEKWRAAGKSSWWTGGALLVSALAVGLGTLTDYVFVATLLPLMLYVGLSFPQHWKRRVLLVLGVFVLLQLPWMARNFKVARRPFGLAYFRLFEHTGVGTDNELRPGDVQRSLAVDDLKLRWRAVARKIVLDTQTVYETTLKEMGGNYLFAFFLVSLMHRWRTDEVYRLRRYVFWSVLCALGWLALTGPPARNVLTIFLPLVIVYAVAFFYVLFERLQFRTRILRYGMVGGFVVLNCVAFIYKVLPPATTIPYPPYNALLARAVGQVFSEDSLLASDIPEALAWYSDRGTVWLPDGNEDYLVINDGVKFISAIYLTQVSTDRVNVGEITQAMAGGTALPWLRAFPLQRLPPNFPLRSVQPLPPDNKQYLISNLGAPQ